MQKCLFSHIIIFFKVIHTIISLVMKKLLFLTTLLFMLPLSSGGQVRLIEEDGAFYDCLGNGGVGDVIFSYRVIYGRYPHNKRELLAFLSAGDERMIEGAIVERKTALMKQIKNRKNRLSTSGDSCSFCMADEKITIQCTGGMKELLNTDYEAFRFMTQASCFDRKGRYKPSLYAESPSLPKDELSQFRYVVMMEPRYPVEEFPIIREGMRPVMIPVTMNRSGRFDCDLSILDGIPLYYSEIGSSFQTEICGPTSIKEALDPDYLETLKVFMKDFLDEHPEVGSMKLWERLLFKKIGDKMH